MKILNLAKLGLKKISENKKRSILTVVIIGVLFGLLNGIAFLYKGLENRLIEESLRFTGGRIYISYGGCADFEACESSEDTILKAELYAKKYNAVLEGSIAHYIYKDESGLPNAIVTIPEKFVENLSLSESEMTKEVPHYSNNSANTGLLSIPLSSIERRVWSLNALLSSETDEEVIELVKEKPKTFVEPILSFENIEDALRFYAEELCATDSDLNCTHTKLNYREFFGNALSTKLLFLRLLAVFRKVELVLGIVALIITVFTFLRIVQENSKTIALYLSLGAKKKDVFCIFFIFLIALCVLSSIFSVAVGSLFSLTVGLINSTKLSEFFSAVFLSDIKINVVFGYSSEILRIVLVLFISAPTASILTIDQLSPKNIAKNMK